MGVAGLAGVRKALLKCELWWRARLEACVALGICLRVEAIANGRRRTNAMIKVMLLIAGL